MCQSGITSADSRHHAQPSDSLYTSYIIEKIPLRGYLPNSLRHVLPRSQAVVETQAATPIDNMWQRGHYLG